jgi:hypothetical protein
MRRLAAILRPVQWLPPGTICGLGLRFDLLPPSFPNILFWACIYILLLTLKSPPHLSLPLLGVSVLSLSRQFREQIKSLCIHHHSSLMVDPASHNPFGWSHRAKRSSTKKHGDNICGCLWRSWLMTDYWMRLPFLILNRLVVDIVIQQLCINVSYAFNLIGLWKVMVAQRRRWHNTRRGVWRRAWWPAMAATSHTGTPVPLLSLSFLHLPLLLHLWIFLKFCHLMKRQCLCPVVWSSEA